MKYYAIHKGHRIGIFTEWDECKKYISGYSKAIYKKFNNKEIAENFVKFGHQASLANNVQCDNNKTEFIPDIIVYTDGACSNNGKENAIAGMGVYFEENDIRNVSKKIEGKQTNNTAEPSAIIEVYNSLENEIKNGKNILIYSDSLYSIKCCKTYGDKLYKKNWGQGSKKIIPNLELVKKAYLLFKDKDNIKFEYINKHIINIYLHYQNRKNASENILKQLNQMSLNYLNYIFLQKNYKKHFCLKSD